MPSITVKEVSHVTQPVNSITVGEYFLYEGQVYIRLPEDDTTAGVKAFSCVRKEYTAFTPITVVAPLYGELTLTKQSWG